MDCYPGQRAEGETTESLLEGKVFVCVCCFNNSIFYRIWSSGLMRVCVEDTTHSLASIVRVYIQC